MKTMHPIVKPVLYTSATLKDGSHPIMIRLCFENKKKYYSLGYSLPKSLWSHTDKLPNKNGRKMYPSLTSIIQSEILKATNIIQDYSRDKKQSISLDQLYDILTNKEKKSDHHTLKYFDIIIDRFKEAGKAKTAYIFSDAKRVFKKYLDETNKGKDILLTSLTLEIIKDFHEFLRGDSFTNRSGGKGLGESSVSLYLRTFRGLINKAKDEKIISKDNDPYAGFKISNSIETRKKFITEEDIDKLKKFSSNDKNLIFARDMFLFSYYTYGMNFKDMAYLKLENRRKGRIEYERSKTAKKAKGDISNLVTNQKNIITIPISPEIQALLDKYSEPGNPFLLPILNDRYSVVTPANRKTMMMSIMNRIEKLNKQVNRDIKKVAEECGIEENITFYAARHTFATVLQRRGTSIAVIQQTMGHKTELQTNTYLGGLSWDAVHAAVGVL